MGLSRKGIIMEEKDAYCGRHQGWVNLMIKRRLLWNSQSKNPQLFLSPNPLDDYFNYEGP